MFVYKAEPCSKSVGIPGDKVLDMTENAVIAGSMGMMF